MAADFVNARTEYEGVHYTRYIASWLKVGGSIDDCSTERFRDWLRHHHVTEDEINDIELIMDNGRLELQTTAKEWLKKEPY